MESNGNSCKVDNHKNEKIIYVEKKTKKPSYNCHHSISAYFSLLLKSENEND